MDRDIFYNTAKLSHPEQETKNGVRHDKLTIHERGPNLLLTHLKNIIEKSSGSNPMF